MIARTYLMADFGKGPRVVSRGGEAYRQMTYFRDDPHPTVRAWWLVEASSADAARAIIREDDGRGACACGHFKADHRVGGIGCQSWAPFRYTVRLGANLAAGRILASVGKP